MSKQKALEILQAQYLQAKRRMAEIKSKMLRITDGRSYELHVNHDSAYWTEIYPNASMAFLAALEHEESGFYVDIVTDNQALIDFVEYHNIDKTEDFEPHIHAFHK